jgi:hypothetical protein
LEKEFLSNYNRIYKMKNEINKNIEKKNLLLIFIIYVKEKFTLTQN